MVRVFVCGDVMLGRGIDQIQDVRCDPQIFESYVKNARDYVQFAVRRNGQLPTERDASYIWGDAIAILEHYKPRVRLINLETAVTKRGTPWPGKGIQYRMHPDNVRLLQAARIDAVSLANNHVLDWGYEGLSDSVKALTSFGVTSIGAGVTQELASAVGCFPAGNNMSVLVCAIAHPSSGVPHDWAATSDSAGVNFVANLTDSTVKRLCANLKKRRTSEHDVGIVSIHWGGNWGYEVPTAFRDFAHRLIDSGMVSLVHGHSSHHVKGFEIYKKRLILYGCGDFVNDYEGIFGPDKEHFKDYLSLMYFVDFHPDTGNVCGLSMVPTRLMRLRVQRASEEEARSLLAILQRECEKFGPVQFSRGADGSIQLVL